MADRSTLTREFLAPLDEAGKRLSTAGPAWLRSFREQGRADFESAGLPEPGDEAWRGTNLAGLAATRFRPAAPGPRKEVPAGLASFRPGPSRLTFVDGRFEPTLSHLDGLPDGVWAGSLARAVVEVPDRLQEQLTPRDGVTNAFRDLNGAFLEDGAVLLLPDGAVLDAPFTILYLSGSPDPASAGPSVSHPRTLIVAGNGARATVVETYAASGPAEYFTNAVSECVLGDGAHLTRCRIQCESDRAYHIADVYSRQGRDSRYVSLCLDLGGKLVRQNLRAVLAGEGGWCNLLGLYLPRGSQHVDHHTAIDHAVPHCDSRELYKGILADRARSVFTGRILVRPGAQKTDAKQSNPNLLLSGDALAETRPQLEIYASDVKCTHGATVGQLDADSLFYLQSRGIPRDEARRLLVHAFADEVLDNLKDPALAEALTAAVHARLDGTDRP